MGEEHLGKCQIYKAKAEDMFLANRISYRRFVKRIPSLVSAKFPVKQEVGGHTYRLEVDNVRVVADLDEDTLTDPLNYVEPRKTCRQLSKMLSYNVDGKLTLYKDGARVATVNKHLFEIPAMTGGSSFIIGGIEKDIKIESRVGNASRFIGCGELFADLISETNFEGIIESNLRYMAENTKGNGLDQVEMSSLADRFREVSRMPVTISRSGNPLTEVSSGASVYNQELDEDDNTDITMSDPYDFSMTNEGIFKAAWIPFLSMMNKKEGRGLVPNSKINMCAGIDKKGRPCVLAHTVKNGKISPEIKYITVEDLAKNGGARVADYIPVGESVPPETGVIQYKTKSVIKGRGKDKQEYQDLDYDEGTVKENGMPDFVMITPWAKMSVAEAFSTFIFNFNPARAGGLGIAQIGQALPVVGAGKPRVSTGVEDAIVKATEACLRSPVSGTVVDVKDKEYIKIKREDGKVCTIDLDERFIVNDTIDHRYHTTLKVGDDVKKGQVIGDGPFTREGELTVYVPDIITMAIPFTAVSSLVNGFEITGRGAGGSNNNDGIIISESAAKKFTTTQVVKMSMNLAGGAILGKPALEDGTPDPRYDKDGIPKIGERFRYGDVVFDQKVPDVSASADVLGLHANPDSMEGRRTIAKTIEKNIDAVVTAIEKNGSNVDVYLSYTRELQVGDKITLEDGQKATIAAIIPDSKMPTFEMNGKTMIPELLVDPVSFVKRMVPLVVKGNLSMALKEENKYAIVGNQETDLLGIACNEADLAGIPVDAFYKLTSLPLGDSQKKYLPRKTLPDMVAVFVANVCLNSHQAADGITKFGRDATLARMEHDAAARLSEKSKWAIFNDRDRAKKKGDVKTALLSMGIETGEKKKQTVRLKKSENISR